VVATLAFSFILSLGILKLVDLVVGLRVTEDEELAGLDVSQHEEVGYAFSEGVGSAAHVPTGAAPPERAPSTVRVPQGDLG
jgi:Amt family ammonium transporter